MSSLYIDISIQMVYVCMLYIYSTLIVANNEGEIDERVHEQSVVVCLRSGYELSLYIYIYLNIYIVCVFV